MAEFPTVKYIIAKWLEDNDFDGLACGGYECGCEVGDLMPCGEYCGDCEAGFKGPDPNEDCDFMIYLTIEAADKARQEIKNKT